MDMLQHKGWIPALLLIGLLIAERLRPAARNRGAPHRLWDNFGLYAANILVSLAVVLPVTWAADHLTGWRGDGQLDLWLIADLLVLDLWIYAWHRLNHQSQRLWQLHVVHHLDRHLDASSAVRFHPLEVAASALARAPVILIQDIPLAHVLIFETCVQAAALFQHSNLRLPPRLDRALAWVIVTPGHHWLHHHARRQETDSNYGTILTLWDRLFGTLAQMRRHPDMPIGVEGETLDGLKPLMLRPLRGWGLLRRK